MNVPSVAADAAFVWIARLFESSALQQLLTGEDVDFDTLQ